MILLIRTGLKSVRYIKLMQECKTIWRWTLFSVTLFVYNSFNNW